MKAEKVPGLVDRVSYANYGLLEKSLHNCRHRSADSWADGFALHHRGSGVVPVGDAITNGERQDEWMDCDVGWLDAREVRLTPVPENSFLSCTLLLLYCRLLSEKDCLEILALPADGYGLWKYEDELLDQDSD